MFFKAEHSPNPWKCLYLEYWIACSFVTLLLRPELSIKSALFPTKYITILSSVAFLTVSSQKSIFSKVLKFVISYTKYAPSAFLIWLVVIARYLSAPAILNKYYFIYFDLHVSQIWMLNTFDGSFGSTSSTSI